jgi:hypothetical protein
MRVASIETSLITTFSEFNLAVEFVELTFNMTRECESTLIERMAKYGCLSDGLVRKGDTKK